MTESYVSMTEASTVIEESVYGDDGDEGFVEVDLPEYACTYCGLSDQSCVVKCVESGKFFQCSDATSSFHIKYFVIQN